VDVNARIAWFFLLLALVTAPALVLAAADRPAATAPASIQGLSYDAHEGSLTVTLRTSAPLTRYSLNLPSGPGAEVVLVVPEATSALQSRYASESPLLTEIRVKPGEGGAGIEVHFILAKSAFMGVGQADGGIVLRFAALSEPAAGADPARLPEYKVGPGDKLEISVFAHDDLSKVVEVRGDGTINYPLIGNLEVAGKTVSQIDDELTRILGKDFLVDPQVSVDVREYQSQWVTIIGEVRNPGQYVLKRNMRLIDLLAAAGGVTKEAGSEALITRRAEDENAPRHILVDRDGTLSQENGGGNPLLVHGDIVTIGEKKVFFIRGEVNKPGMYYLENGMTVMKAISVAGGLAQFANRKDIQLLRADGGHREKLTVNLKAIESGKKEDISLHPNDTIIVPRRIF
jgi:polysaccharide export outer membrane protein